MTKTIALEVLEHDLPAVLEEIAADRTAYVVMRHDRPEVALVSYSEYQRLTGREEARVLSRFDELVERMARSNAAFTDDEVERDVAAAVAEVRR